MTHTHDIRFEVRLVDGRTDTKQVIPVVDGTDLTDLVHDFERQAGMETREVSYSGLIPTFFRFGPMSVHFHAGEGAFKDEQGRVPLLGCECGEWGCWPLLAQINADDEFVVWRGLHQPHRPERDYADLGEFRFARAVYDEALVSLEQELAQDS